MCCTESLVIRRNHQFLLENIDSTGLVSLLHKNGCITVEEQHHLNNEPFSFYRNDALLQWMRTISFKQERGRRVIDCFRQTNQNFIVDLLETGGGSDLFCLIAKISKHSNTLNDDWHTCSLASYLFDFHCISQCYIVTGTQWRNAVGQGRAAAPGRNLKKRGLKNRNLRKYCVKRVKIMESCEQNL